jgi:hypothetical protein
MLVGRSIDADTTVSGMERLVAERGAPAYVRCDNGPQLTGHALQDWCRLQQTATAFIEPARRGRTRSSNRSTPCTRRAARRRGVLLPSRSPGRDLRLAGGLQPAPPSLRARDARAGRLRRLALSSRSRAARPTAAGEGAKTALAPPPPTRPRPRDPIPTARTAEPGCGNQLHRDPITTPSLDTVHDRLQPSSSHQGGPTNGVRSLCRWRFNVRRGRRARRYVGLYGQDLDVATAPLPDRPSTSTMVLCWHRGGIPARAVLVQPPRWLRTPTDEPRCRVVRRIALWPARRAALARLRVR